MTPARYLGIEIGGTKLQLGVGPGNGSLHDLWRARIDPVAGAKGIRDQILQGIPELLRKAQLNQSDINGIGVGFGGPVDSAKGTIIKSHQVAGWDGFPLVSWLGDELGLPAILGNDADVAGLGEALFGAGRRYSPVFYITIGSGIGGGLVIDGRIYRGFGLGAAEIGHLRLRKPDGTYEILEHLASGWAIENTARIQLGKPLSVASVAALASAGDPGAKQILGDAWHCLAEGICQMIALLAPRRVVIGGGVSLLGEQILFEPLRQLVNARVFAPFRGCFEIVPAALGEEMVIHGALALAAVEDVHGVVSQG